jgi:hypothetical protein
MSSLFNRPRARARPRARLVECATTADVHRKNWLPMSLDALGSNLRARGRGRLVKGAHPYR